MKKTNDEAPFSITKSCKYKANCHMSQDRETESGETQESTENENEPSKTNNTPLSCSEENDSKCWSDSSEILDLEFTARRKRKRSTLDHSRRSKDRSVRVRETGRRYDLFDNALHEERVTELPRDVLITVLEHFINLHSSEEESSPPASEDREDDQVLSALFSAEECDPVDVDSPTVEFDDGSDSLPNVCSSAGYISSDVDDKDRTVVNCSSAVSSSCRESASETNVLENRMLSVVRHRRFVKKRRDNTPSGRALLKSWLLCNLEPGWPKDSRCPPPGTSSLWCRLRVSEATVFAMMSHCDRAQSLEELKEAMHSLLLAFPFTIRLVWQLALSVARLIIDETRVHSLIARMVPLFARLPDIDASSAVLSAHALLLSAGHTVSAENTALVPTVRPSLALRGARLFNAFQHEVVKCHARVMTAEQEISRRAMSEVLCSRLEVGCVGPLNTALDPLLRVCREQLVRDRGR